MKDIPIVGVDDFALDGSGAAAAWSRAQWLDLAHLRGEMTYRTRAKIAWSPSGIYALFDCDDRRLSCSNHRDGEDLYDEDVVEIFLQPDARVPLYLEYELSPLGHELLLLVPNRGGRFRGWSPWKYDDVDDLGQPMVRRALRATAVRGGVRAPGAAVTGWTAELFLPFALFTGFADTPPNAGDRWRLNLFRIDYDAGPEKPTLWTLSTVSGETFHDPDRFAVGVFG